MSVRKYGSLQMMLRHVVWYKLTVSEVLTTSSIKTEDEDSVFLRKTETAKELSHRRRHSLLALTAVPVLSHSTQ